MADARKRRFDLVLVWRFDRFDRSTKHLEWRCPRPPQGELTAEQRASLQYAKETVSALLAISRTNAENYGAADVVLTEIAELFEEAS